MVATDDKESFASIFETSDHAKRTRTKLRQGARVDVKVIAIGQNAVFVDLGTKEEGYFERGELVDRNGNLTVEVGSSIAAVVSQTDGEKIKLTPVFVRRAAEAVIETQGQEVRFPTGKAGPLLVEGAHVRGTVTGVERYGVFVQIDGTNGRNGRGLVPVSETGTQRGADLKKLFPDGQAVEAKILAVQEDGKIRLSFKALADDVERSEYEAYARGEDPAAKAGATDAAAPGGAKKKAEKPVPRNFGTFADLLGGASQKLAKAAADKAANDKADKAAKPAAAAKKK